MDGIKGNVTGGIKRQTTAPPRQQPGMPALADRQPSIKDPSTPIKSTTVADASTRTDAPSNPSASANITAAQADIARGVLGEPATEGTPSTEKKKSDKFEPVTVKDSEGRLISSTTMETVGGKQVKKKETHNYHNGNKSESVTEHYAPSGDSDKILERNTTEYIQYGKKVDSPDKHSEKREVFDGKSDKPIKEYRKYYHYPSSEGISSEMVKDNEKGYEMNVRFDEKRPGEDYGEHGKVSHCDIKKKNPDGSEFSINASTRDDYFSVECKGEGTLTLEEMKKGFSNLKGAPELIEEMEKNGAKDVKVSKDKDGNTVFSFTKSYNKNDRYSLTIKNNERGYPDKAVYEHSYKYGDYEDVTTKTYDTSGNRTESESKYYKDTLREQKEKTLHKNGDITERKYERSYSGDTAKETVTEYGRNYYPYKGERQIEHDYAKNTRTEKVIGEDRKIKEENSYYASQKGGQIDVKESERYYNGKKTGDKTVYQDKNLDEKFEPWSEKVETYSYGDTTVKRKDMNYWTVFSKDSYYDNLMNYLGDSDTILNQHVEKHGNIVTSTFTSTDPKHKNVEISFGYDNAHGDITRDPKKFNDERPAFVTFKHTKSDGTVIEKTAFPGSKENYVTHVKEKVGAYDEWEKDVTHTHLMDSRNPKKIDMQVTELATDKASVYSIEHRAEEIGISPMPDSFKQFKEKAGNGKMAIHMKEEKDSSTNPPTVKKSIVCVNPETGDQYILKDEGKGNVVSYYKDAKSGEEYVDMGDATIRKVGDKFMVYEKDAYGKMKLKSEEIIRLENEHTAADVKIGAKGGKLGTSGAMGLFEMLGKTSKGAGGNVAKNMGKFLHKHNTGSYFLSKNADRMNTALGALITTSTIVDIMNSKNVSAGQVSELVGNVADMGIDATKLNVAKNLAMKAARTSDASRVASGLKITGKALGVVSIGSNLVSAGMNIANGDYFAASLDGLAAAGTAIAVFAGSTSWAGPVGWAVAAVGIGGSLIYYRIKEDEINPLGSSPLEKQYYMTNGLPR